MVRAQRCGNGEAWIPSSCVWEKDLEDYRWVRHRSAGQERFSGHLQMCPRLVALWETGRESSLQVCRWVQHHQHSLSAQRGHDLQDPHSEEENPPGLCVSSCALPKPVMPMAIQREPICSAQPRFGDLSTGTLPLPPAGQAVSPLPAQAALFRAHGIVGN